MAPLTWRSLVIGLALVVACAVIAQPQQTKIYPLDCWSGIYGPNNTCSICGPPGDYNTNRYYSSGEPYPGEPWQPTCGYQDTLQPGTLVTGVMATFFMKNCSSDNDGDGAYRLTFNATLNGHSIATPITIDEPDCFCNSVCMQAIFNNANTAGVVGYVAGGTNVLGIDVTTGVLTLDHVEIKVTYVPSEEARITALDPFIPTGSSVVNKCVLYRSLLTAKLTDGGLPAPGRTITLQSSRNVGGAAPDTLIQPIAPTDSTGTTEGRVETRKTGVASISAQNYKTAQPASITFDEATYESVFLITTYYTPKETDFNAKPTTTNPCGITGTYRSKFLSAVKLEGSGIAVNGTTIQYYNGCYHTDSCPRTTSGVCAQVGVTAAIDPGIVPMSSEFNITGIGIRTAQDTGEAIDGYHIDDYVGVGIANYFGNSYNRAVRLLQGDTSCAN